MDIIADFRGFVCAKGHYAMMIKFSEKMNILFG